MPSPERSKLLVTVDIWSGLIQFRSVRGGVKSVDWVDDARVYAAKNGYTGIKVVFTKTREKTSAKVQSKEKQRA